MLKIFNEEETSITPHKHILAPFLQDEDIAMLIVESPRSEWDLIPDSLLKNHEFILKALLVEPNIIKHINGADNEEYIRHIARAKHEDWFCLASDRIQNDRGFILDILKSTGAHLYTETNKYSDDEEVLLTAHYWGNISERLCTDATFMSKFLLTNPNLLYLCKVAIPGEIINKILCNSDDSVRYYKLRRCNPCIHKSLLAYNGMMLEYISREHRTPELIGVAVMQNKEAVKFV